MASTYSPKLRLELIGAGEQAGLWGTTTNKNIGQLLEQAIAGVTTVELDGLSGNYTLTALDGAPDQSRSAVIKCTYAATPASGAINLIIPTQTKLYVVRNDCGQNLTVKTSAQVGGVLLEQGEATLVFCDGTNAILGLETAAAGTLGVDGGGTGVSTFGGGGFIKSSGGTAALSASAVNLSTSDTTGTLPVSKGGTGATSLTSGRALIGNGTGAVATLAGSNNGDVMTWSTSLSTWVAQAPTGGVTSVTAASPLASSGGTTPQISLTGTVPVANGGTGSTNAAGARSNLGVPANDGTGATGTWNIDINGDANYANSAGSASTATTATSVSSITNFFTGSNQSLSGNGYQKLPGGVIIQWGAAPVTGGQTTVSFPLTFPFGCFGLVVSRYKPGSSGGIGTGTGIATVPTSSSFVASTDNNVIDSVTWIAIGW